MTSVRKTLSIIAIAFLAACASSTFTQGREFSTENVSQIVKGKTTEADIAQLFGAPFSKTVKEDGTEIWLYTYTVGESTAHVYLFYASTHTTGTQKTLNVTLAKGVVTTFSYTEGAVPGSN